MPPRFFLAATPRTDHCRTSNDAAISIYHPRRAGVRGSTGRGRQKRHTPILSPHIPLTSHCKLAVGLRLSRQRAAQTGCFRIPGVTQGAHGMVSLGQERTVLRQRLRELGERLAEAEKLLLAVPATKLQAANNRINDIKAAIGVLRAAE